jgi:glycosyltransferase involved in cell wall biosynthesis
MKFSVIIPFYNAADTLGQCLKSFTKQIFNDFELILVDNNSNDHSNMIAARFAHSPHPFPVRLICETEAGPGSARNAGIAIAQGDWVVFTDADCIISSSWLGDYAQKTDHVDENIGAIAGSIHFTQPVNPVQACACLFTLPPIREEQTFHQLTHGTGGFPTANLAVRKSVLEEIGGFRNGKVYGEDYHLCTKIYKAGYRIHAFTDAMLEHIHRDKLRPFLKQAYNIGYSHAYGLRNLSGRKIVIELPFYTLHIPHVGRIWIDLQSADKKMIVSLIPMFFWLPMIVFPLLFLSYLSAFCLRKSIQNHTHLPPRWLPLIALILIAKSAAISWGRLRGSQEYGVICL